MSKKLAYVIATMTVLALAVGIDAFFERDVSEKIDECVPIDREARIYPDYRSIVIPPNIAAMNFAVCENGELYCVRIKSVKGGSIEVFSRTDKIEINPKRWSRLLRQNKGEKLEIEVFCKGKDGKWLGYSPIRNTIGREEIDAYVV